MKSTSLVVISVSLILFSFGCSKDRELSEIEHNLLVSELRSLQNTYLNNLDLQGDDLHLFSEARRIHDTIPNSIYVMVQNPEGKVFAHNVPLKINEMLDDVYTKNALQHRDTEEPLIQSWKSEDGRDIMDLTLAVMDKSNPPEFRGVVRLALYVNN